MGDEEKAEAAPAAEHTKERMIIKHRDEDDEIRDLPDSISFCEAFMHMLKSNVSPGILAASNAFSHAGLYTGLVFTVGLAVFGSISNCLLASASRRMSKKLGTPGFEYPDLAEQSFLNGSVGFQNFAKLFRFTVSSILLVNMIGNCAVYVLFVADSTKLIFDYYTGADTNLKIYMFFLLWILIMLNLVRNLNYLAPFSIIALALQIVSLFFLLYSLSKDIPEMSERPAMGDNLKFMFLFFATAMYCVQQPCTVILTVDSQMRRPRSLTVFPAGAIHLTMLFTAIIVCSVGYVGYMKYDQPATSIILNLPKAAATTQVINILFSIGVVLSYPLFFLVSFNILWPVISTSTVITEENIDKFEYCARISLVLLTVIIAAVVPLLGTLINVVGSVAISSLGFIIPALIHMSAFSDDPRARTGFDFVLAGIGIGLFVVATGTSFYEVSNQIESGVLDRYYYEEY